MKFDFNILGMEALLKKLQKETIKEPAKAGITKIALWTLRTVKFSAPVNTGRLRSSMTSEVAGEMAKIGTNVTYAPFVEYGTKFMEARHVEEGGSSRILGTGPFTRTMQLLQDKVKEFIDEIGKAISVKFG